MSEFKCKYCGNSLHPEEGQTLIRCSRCDETTRIVTIDDAKKYRLLQEANELRIGCLFDRAMQRYESIIQEYPNDSDAYWGYVLCVYGVEFQDDVRTGKRLPTLHRISNRSILKDPYYKRAVEYANPIDAADYERIANELEHIRQRFIELSQKEENIYDIFISFKQTDDDTHKETVDCSKAENLYHKLHEMGYNVFFSKISLANRGGDDYEPIIYTALDTAKVMLVIGSSRENLEAPWVRNEWNRFLDMMRKNPRKKLLPIFFDEMVPEMLPEALRGLQGYNIDTQIGVDRVLSRVKQLLPYKKEPENTGQIIEKTVVVSNGSLLKRARMEADAQNWEVAAGYYNRILESDPECAEAWIGYLLSSEDKKFVDIYQYGEYLVDSALNVKEETRTIYTENHSLGEEGVEKYVVKNYLSEEEIINLLPKNLSIASVAKPMSRRYEEIIEWFHTNRYYNYAVKYADEEYTEILKQFQKNVLDTIAESLKKVEDNESKKMEMLREKYSCQMKEAKDIIQIKYQEAVEERERDYQKGINAKNGKDVPEAIKYLKKVGDYLDSKKKLYTYVKLQEVNDAVGDGNMYLLKRMAEEQPYLLTRYQTTVSSLSIPSYGGFGKWMIWGVRGMEKWIILAIYLFFTVMFLVSGNAGTIGCTILGIIMGGFFWKQNKPYIAFVCWAVMQLIAGVIWSPDLSALLAVIYIYSLARSKGFVRTVLSKKREMAKVNEIVDLIQSYEKEARDSINIIWKNALGIEYDGVRLQNIMKILKKNPYAIQLSENESSFLNIKKQDTDDSAEQQGESKRDEMVIDFNEFEKIFNDMWNMGMKNKKK